jgi:hypothetical protein
MTPSSCPIHLTVRGHIFLIRLPFTSAHIDQRYTSDVLHPALSLSKRLISIYDWPHTHFPSDLTLFSQMDTRPLKFNPISAISHSIHIPCVSRDSFSSTLVMPHPTTSITTNILFELQVLFTEMAPKSKKSKSRENPFLPPPIDLDKIPLANKDHLILDTRCEVDFVELKSWLKDTFLYQSNEIGLWESNLPLYLFP